MMQQDTSGEIRRLRDECARHLEDARLLDAAYEGVAMPSDVGAAFEICIRMIERAKELLVRAESLPS